MARRRVLPKGAGRVNCTACGATAAADGKGTPIALRHKEDCPELKRVRELPDAGPQAGPTQREMLKRYRDRPCRIGCACSGGLGYHA